MIPAWIRSAVHLAFWSSAVKTPDAKPYFVELAISIASSSSLKLITDVTGPKISSWAIVELVLTLSKIVGLKACQFYNEQYQTNYFTLMPCNLYGPNDNYDSKNSHFIPALIKKIVKGKSKKMKTVEVWGSGKPKREIMHVDDLASAIFFILNKKISNKKKFNKFLKDNCVINVGSGQEYSIKEFAMLISILSSKKTKFKFNRKFPDGTKRKILDNSLLNKLGWKPTISVKDGLKSTIDMYIKDINKK